MGSGVSSPRGQPQPRDSITENVIEWNSRLLELKQLHALPTIVKVQLAINDMDYHRSSSLDDLSEIQKKIQCARLRREIARKSFEMERHRSNSLQNGQRMPSIGERRRVRSLGNSPNMNDFRKPSEKLPRIGKEEVLIKTATDVTNETSKVEPIVKPSLLTSTNEEEHIQNIKRLEKKLEDMQQLLTTNDLRFTEMVQMKQQELENKSSKIHVLEKQLNELKDSQRCPICLDNMKNLVLSCGHTLCSSCAKQIFECPLCRQPPLIALPVYL